MVHQSYSQVYVCIKTSGIEIAQHCCLPIWMYCIVFWSRRWRRRICYLLVIWYNTDHRWKYLNIGWSANLLGLQTQLATWVFINTETITHLNKIRQDSYVSVLHILIHECCAYVETYTPNVNIINITLYESLQRWYDEFTPTWFYHPGMV